jgi:hypothetical protein
MDRISLVMSRSIEFRSSVILKIDVLKRNTISGLDSLLMLLLREKVDVLLL